MPLDQFRYEYRHGSALLFDHVSDGLPYVLIFP
jgi:hypothetical protein